MEWATSSEQQIHKLSYNLSPSPFPKNGRGVWQCDPQSGKRLRLFCSATEAARSCGRNIANKISNVALGRRDSKGNVRRTAYGFYWQYVDTIIDNLKNEEWIPLTCIKTVNPYQISNYGRIIGKEGRLHEVQSEQSEYPARKIDGRVYKTHILVASSFLPNPNKFAVVNHKDGRKNNPHVDNLEWCSHAENSYHAGTTGLTVHEIRSVQAFDMSGRLHGTYKTMTEASNKTPANVQNIGCACRGIKGTTEFHRSNGFYWKYENDRKAINGVKAYDTNNQLRGQWLSVKEASLSIGCTIGGINGVCLGDRKTIKGFVVKREKVVLGDFMGFQNGE